MMLHVATRRPCLGLGFDSTVSTRDSAILRLDAARFELKRRFELNDPAIDLRSRMIPLPLLPSHLASCVTLASSPCPCPCPTALWQDVEKAGADYSQSDRSRSWCYTSPTNSHIPAVGLAPPCILKRGSVSPYPRMQAEVVFYAHGAYVRDRVVPLLGRRDALCQFSPCVAEVIDVRASKMHS